jgi:hypothetical protein
VCFLYNDNGGTVAFPKGYLGKGIPVQEKRAVRLLRWQVRAHERKAMFRPKMKCSEKDARLLAETFGRRYWKLTAGFFAAASVHLHEFEKGEDARDNELYERMEKNIRDRCAELRALDMAMRSICGKYGINKQWVYEQSEAEPYNRGDVELLDWYFKLMLGMFNAIFSQSKPESEQWKHTHMVLVQKDTQ